MCKYPICVIAGVLLICISVRAQAIDSALGYFPLAVGDVWQYKDWRQWNGAYSVMSHSLVEVVGDTVVSGGRRYFIVESQLFCGVWTPGRMYLSVDSASGVIYSYEMDSASIVERLRCDSTPSEFWLGCAYSSATKVFGVSTMSKGSYRLRYVYGFGCLEYSLDDMMGFASGSDLVYARIDGREYGSRVAVEPDKASRSALELDVSPNPCSSHATISFAIPTSQHATVMLFDVLGRSTMTVYDRQCEAGPHTITLNANELPGGTYLCRIRSGSRSLVRTLVVAR